MEVVTEGSMVGEKKSVKNKKVFQSVRQSEH